MRALTKLSTSLLAAAALVACGGEIPQDEHTHSHSHDVLEGAESAPTGIGEKPVDSPYVDACADADGVMAGDFLVRHNDDMASLDGIASVEGDLFLSGATSATGLHCLRRVGGDLVIQGTESLKDLEGLERLEQVGGGVWITENTQLASLASLATLKRVGGDIVIERNEALRNLDGIANVGGSLRGGVFIRDNDALQGIVGFHRLDVILGGVVIAGNPMLEDVSGFGSSAGVVKSYGDVVIEDNARLGRVEVPMMAVDQTPNSFTLKNNERLKEVQMRSDGRVRISGDMLIRENPALRTLVGFSNIAHVVGDLRIEDNDAFTSFSSLAGLQGVAGHVLVLGNDGVENLDMTRLESVGGNLMVGRNLSLESLQGLTSLQEVLGELDFFDNPLLSTCSMDQLVTKLETGRSDGTCQR